MKLRVAIINTVFSAFYLLFMHCLNSIAK